MRIIVKGSIAKLVRGKPDVLDRFLRVKDPKAKFDRRYQNGSWDGYHRFFDRDNNTFPSGLVGMLESKIKGTLHARSPLEILYHVDGFRDNFSPDCLFGCTLRDYQADSVSAAMRKLRGILWCATGSGKTEMMAAVARHCLKRKLAPVLVVVPQVGIMRQTAERLSKRLGKSVSVGCVGDGRRDYNAQVVVSCAASLVSGIPDRAKRGKTPHKPIVRRLLERARTMMLDEAHHTGSLSWYHIAMYCDADVRLGFTATAESGDCLQDTRLQAATGPVVARVTTDDLIRRGFLAKPKIYMVMDRKVFGPTVALPVPRMKRFVDGKWKIVEDRKKLYRLEHDEAVILNRRFNKHVLKITRMLIRRGIPPVILTPRTTHLRELRRLAEALNTPLETMDGKLSTAERNKVLRRYAAKQDFAVAATSILDEGIDVPAIGALILAGGGKSMIKTAQRLGRGLRPKPGRNELVVFDFAFLNNEVEMRHADERWGLYEDEGHDVVTVRDMSTFQLRR